MLHEDRIQARLQEQFKLAVLKRNIEGINYLGKKNINPNHVFIAHEQIYSPLIYAITYDYVAMLKALLAIKRIRAQAVVNETTALEVAAVGQNKLMVAILLKSEHINYSQHEIDKAFSIAVKANSSSIEIFLDDYFEQIINYPEDIKQGLQKNSWVLELLSQESNRRYLFNKLLNYLSQSDDDGKLKLLEDILTTEPGNSFHVHPLSRIFTLEFKPVKQSTQSLFSATESELEQLQKYYQSLNRDNAMHSPKQI